MYECDRGKHKTFYDKSFVILKSSFIKDDDSYSPNIEVRDTVALAIFRIVKLGYGTLEQVKNFTAREVIQILKYEDFISNYERIVVERQKNDYRG